MGVPTVGVCVGVGIRSLVCEESEFPNNEGRGKSGPRKAGKRVWFCPLVARDRELSLYHFKPALPRFSQRGADVAERSEMLRAQGKVAAGAGSPMVVSRGWCLRRQALLDFSELF